MEAEKEPLLEKSHKPFSPAQLLGYFHKSGNYTFPSGAMASISSLLHRMATVSPGETDSSLCCVQDLDRLFVVCGLDHTGCGLSGTGRGIKIVDIDTGIRDDL